MDPSAARRTLAVLDHGPAEQLVEPETVAPHAARPTLPGAMPGRSLLAGRG